MLLGQNTNMDKTEARKCLHNTHLVQLEHPECRVSTYTLKPILQITQVDYDRIWADRPVTYERFRMFGRENEFPRLFRHYLHDYWWSGKMHRGEPLTDPYLCKLLEWVRAYTQLPYNQMLVNWYERYHHIGLHSDDEHGLVPGAPIFSFSYGADRIFRIRARVGDERWDVPMPSNTLIVMRDSMQSHYKHEVLRESPTRPVTGTRINVTLRYMH